MNLNLNVIKIAEGFRDKPYICPAGVPSIGYGSTFYENGKKVTMKDPAMTMERADQLLRWYVMTYAIPAINKYVKVKLNDNQISALCSFIYNFGANAFATSTLLKKINANPNDPTIAQELDRWVKAGGKVLPGLVKRRKDEAKLYFQSVNG